jgi:hypothetical protein
MILDINLPQRGCFVGLLQRFVVFSLNLLGFTLVFTKPQKILNLPLSRLAIASFSHLGFPSLSHLNFIDINYIAAKTPSLLPPALPSPFHPPLSGYSSISAPTHESVAPTDMTPRQY